MTWNDRQKWWIIGDSKAFTKAFTKERIPICYISPWESADLNSWSSTGLKLVPSSHQWPHAETGTCQYGSRSACHNACDACCNGKVSMPRIVDVVEQRDVGLWYFEDATDYEWWCFSSHREPAKNGWCIRGTPISRNNHVEERKQGFNDTDKQLYRYFDEKNQRNEAPHTLVLWIFVKTWHSCFIPHKPMIISGKTQMHSDTPFTHLPEVRQCRYKGISLKLVVHVSSSFMYPNVVKLFFFVRCM